MTELLQYIPQQWVGILAFLIIGSMAIAKVAENSEKLAKFIPFGRMYRDYRIRKESELNPATMAKVFEAARDSMMKEENVVLNALERRMNSIVTTSEQQASDIRELQSTIRAFTAWSIYDARWHHRVQVLIAEGNLAVLSVLKHYDFFEFEKIWRTDAFQAAQLSQDLGLNGNGNSHH